MCPRKMNLVIYPTFGLASVGFAALLLVHVASLFGNTSLFDRTMAVLGPGVFVLALPTIFVMGHLARDFKQKDIWRAALRGCPRWMYRTVWGIAAYCWAGFFVLPLLYAGGMDSDANRARTLSGTLLMFYLMSLAVMFSATHVEQFDKSRRCLNGHHVWPLAKFCEECGAPVATTTADAPRAR